MEEYVGVRDGFDREGDGLDPLALKVLPSVRELEELHSADGEMDSDMLVDGVRLPTMR